MPFYSQYHVITFYIIITTKLNKRVINYDEQSNTISEHWFLHNSLVQIYLSSNNNLLFNNSY